MNLIELNILAENNPGINLEKLKQMLELSAKLRQSGTSRYRYNIVAPFGGRANRAARGKPHSRPKNS